MRISEVLALHNEDINLKYSVSGWQTHYRCISGERFQAASDVAATQRPYSPVEWASD
jgi:hypothetical protein